MINSGRTRNITEANILTWGLNFIRATFLVLPLLMTANVALISMILQGLAPVQRHKAHTTFGPSQLIPGRATN